MKRIMKRKCLLLRKTFREFFCLWRYYGFLPALYTLVWWLNFYIKNPFRFRLSKWALLHKTSWLDKHITRNYSEIINRYKNYKNSYELITEPNIWVFWGQGAENMPVLIKACYNQLKSNNKNVHLITNKNINEYIEISPLIFDKLHNGKITWAHFSDLIRMSLLSKYGGLWVDATVWVPKELPFDKLMQMSLFSPNGKATNSKSDMCFWTSLGLNWSGWCLWANHRHALLYGFVREMLAKTIETEKMTLDYVLIDYFITYAVHNLPNVRNEIEKFQNVAGENRGALALLMNSPYDPQKYEELCKNDFVFKLSFRSDWHAKTTDGEPTFYGKLIVGNNSK